MTTATLTEPAPPPATPATPATTAPNEAEETASVAAPAPTSLNLEERVAALEQTVARLTAQSATATKPEADAPWWEKRFGAFKDSPDYDWAMERGAEYRRSQPNAVDNPEAVEF